MGEEVQKKNNGVISNEFRRYIKHFNLPTMCERNESDGTEMRGCRSAGGKNQRNPCQVQWGMMMSPHFLQSLRKSAAVTVTGWATVVSFRQQKQNYHRF